MMLGTIFLIGTGASLTVALLVVKYLRRPLEAVLADLCGTADRARFWTAFSCVALLVMPLIFALDARPEGEAGAAGTAVFAIVGQVKWALIGLAVALMGLGIVVGSFIPRRPAGAAEARAHTEG
jgi:hypothetical protein